jgi:hypothetical protein
MKYKTPVVTMIGPLRFLHFGGQIKLINFEFWSLVPYSTLLEQNLSKGHIVNPSSVLCMFWTLEIIYMRLNVNFYQCSRIASPHTTRDILCKVFHFCCL